MRALIIGGGIAGTTAALALQRIGWEPTVYEARGGSASGGPGQGVFLTVAVNGLAALDAVGAGDAVRELGFETRRMRFTSGSGKQLGALPAGPAGVRDMTRTVRRSELYATLTALARDRGIEVVDGARLSGARQGGGQVTAAFADGSSATADLLLGADGIRSTVRGVIDPSAPQPQSSGLANVGGFARVEGIGFDGGDYRMTWGRRAFFGHVVAPNDEIWWFANPPTAALGQVPDGSTGTELLAELAELYAPDAGPAAEIVRAATSAFSERDGWELPRVPTWSSGRMVLIGDAAHAVSPATGQGASLAIEDAVVLAASLRSHGDDVGGAIAAYEAARRPRTDRVVAYGKRLGGTKAAGPIGSRLRDLLLPLGLKAAGSARAQAKQAWLFDHAAVLGSAPAELSRR